MIVIDSSIWVDVARDRSGLRGVQLRARVGDEAMCMSHWTAFEILSGARDEAQWRRLLDEVDGFRFRDLAAEGWRDAARVRFELRRRGLTVASTPDFLIAQLALELNALLLHRDRDFGVIAQVRPQLKHEYLAWREFA